jgi:hypothetical protein
VKDLVKIIDACGKNGVSSFKMGDVEIIFNGFVIHAESDYPDKVDNVIKDPNFDAQQDFEEGIQEDDLLMINDPLQYEEKLLRDELEDEEY